MSLYPILQGAEPIFLSGNSIGILICHGFNGTPQSMKYLGTRFAEQGFTVSVPRLRGHGTDVLDMEKASYKDWIADLLTAYEELKKTCSEVYILGQSMGGALALEIASKTACDGIMTINAALQVPEYEKYKGSLTPRFLSEGEPDIHNKEAEELTYDQVPLKAVRELLKLMERVKGKLSQVNCPVLVLYSPEDHVVPASCSLELYDSVSSKEKALIKLDRSYHVASLDFDQDKIVDEAARFIVQVSKELRVS
ncbi:alpha/beta hydrolase [Bacillus massiliglaciei]|uniref:alpha/beta hydrolase n=1 Tax=Bacillus massiliglaciei TaxID=1816693 RepID=UPI000DA5EC3A|nr:alpha/beta fold hydrolase [Bacillus massiliglaciei]